MHKGNQFAQLCHKLLTGTSFCGSVLPVFHCLDCLEVVLNYVGGAYIYIRALEMRLFGFSFVTCFLPEASQGREYAGRIRILLKSWGTASNKAPAVVITCLLLNCS